MASSPLLRTADELIQSMPRPQGKTVFVHGDVWPGNVVWTSDRACTLIDWKTAGVGHPGVDLGELRKQLAIMYGADARRSVADGWEEASGLTAADLAYWDAVAALNTRTDIGPVESLRRDAFLRAALDRLVG